MQRGDKLFVRIDYKVPGSEMSNEDFQAHIEYLKSVASKRRFLGGGFTNEPGGMIIFKASNLDEAKSIADNDPIIKKELYRYQLHEWELVIVAEGN